MERMILKFVRELSFIDNYNDLEFVKIKSKCIFLMIVDY